MEHGIAEQGTRVVLQADEPVESGEAAAMSGPRCRLRPRP